MRCIDEVPAKELRGAYVLVRSDFNVPLDAAGDVVDTFRLRRGWDTLQYLSARGARVIVISHIGRKPEGTLEGVARALRACGPVLFVPALRGHLVESARAGMRDGDIMLLENLRRDEREASGDESLARELAALASLYVDDAFAAAHRAHASIVALAHLLPAYAGLLLREEVRQIDAARAPAHPSLAILGGAKFETKEPLITLLLATYDKVFITGALANDVFKARGLPVGRSLTSDTLPKEAVLAHPNLLAPVDVTVETPDKQARVKRPEDVSAEDTIVDVGPDSIALLAPHLANARFFLWNGPTGLYEKGYVHYTHALASLVAQSDARKVIGGGDTIAVLQESGVAHERLGFLSTGGGAMLEYLLTGTLPGIEALA